MEMRLILLMMSMHVCCCGRNEKSVSEPESLLGKNVREDRNGRQFHECAQPDRGTHVVAEDEETGPKGPHLGERQPV